MAEIIRMPRLSDTMEEGVIVEWLKKVGDKVEPGDVLAEVETDKATMELENFHEGYLLHIGVEEGAVPVDGILAVIGEKDEDYEKQLKEAQQEDKQDGEEEKEEAKSKSESEEEGDGEAPAPVPDESAEPPPEERRESPRPAGESGKRVKASPLARAMADKAGIDIASISGSGDQGRVIKRDIEEAISSGAPARAKAQPAIPEYGETPVSQMRKTIARRLSESKFDAPHFYLTIEINMSQAVADRKRINEDAEIRISFNDLIVKACAVAIKQHPGINSSWLGDKIRINKDINIGVAVAVDEGLLVPVVRHADRKMLREIHEEVVDYAERARQKKLQLEEMQGNTFTISNLGMLGIEEFTAIINPPDSCILAVGAIIAKPVVVDGEIEIADMMKVTMSCDHRVVDGATGARFLQTLKQLLESPVRMLA